MWYFGDTSGLNKFLNFYYREICSTNATRDLLKVEDIIGRICKKKILWLDVPKELVPKTIWIVNKFKFLR